MELLCLKGRTQMVKTRRVWCTLIMHTQALIATSVTAWTGILGHLERDTASWITSTKDLLVSFQTPMTSSARPATQQKMKMRTLNIASSAVPPTHCQHAPGLEDLQMASVLVEKTIRAETTSLNSFETTTTTELVRLPALSTLGRYAVPRFPSWINVRGLVAMKPVRMAGTDSKICLSTQDQVSFLFMMLYRHF